MAEEEKIRKIADLRELLEERAKNMETELEGLRALLDFINTLLLEKSFKKVNEIAKPATREVPEAPPPAEPPTEEAKVVPLKTAAGELLANLYAEDGSMRIVPAEDKKFNVNTPPFSAFLVERVLVRMQDSDKEAVQRGEIMPDQAFSFNVEKDGDTIHSITIRNAAPTRERELRSAIRWTLEKMHEKVKGSA
jgi:hypothetical protein